MSDAEAKHTVEARAPQHVPGEVGLWVFVFGDMVIFTLLFGLIVATAARHPNLVSSSQTALHVNLGITNTLVLLIGSLLVIVGTDRARRRLPTASLYFAATAVCGAVFAAVKVTEYALLFADGIGVAHNAYFIHYFTFTFIHLAHLVVGTVLMTILAVVTRNPVDDPRRTRFVEVGSIYWHLVDLLWLILFPLLYLVRR